MEGLIAKEEKPSNTEVLGLLMDDSKLKYITNLNSINIRGLCRLSYALKRLQDPNRDAVDIHEEVIKDFLTFKCSEKQRDGKSEKNRADQVVDALKHIIEDESQEDVKNLMQQIKN